MIHYPTLFLKRVYLIKIILSLFLLFFISIYFFGNLRITWFLFDLSVVLSAVYLLTLKKFILNKYLMFILGITFFLLLFEIIFIQYFDIISLIALYYMIRPFFIIGFLFHILKKPYYNKQIMDFLSIYYKIILYGFFISIPIIYLQFINGVYMDDITGLMGKGSTHIMAETWLLLLTFLMFYQKKSIFYIFLFSIIMIFLSIISSIRAFIILLLIWLLGTFLLKKYSLYKILFYILISSSIFLILFYYIYFFQQDLSNEIQRYFYIYEKISANTSHDERTSLLLEAINSKYGSFFGSGLGSYSNIFIFNGEYYNTGPTHLGMHQISLLIMENGLLFSFFLISLYSIFFQIMINKKFSLIKFFIIFCFVCVAFFFAPFYSDPRAVYLISMNIFVISFYFSNKSIINLKKNSNFLFTILKTTKKRCKIK